MIVNIDIDSQIPIYEQLKNQIIHGVLTNQLVHQEHLPSVRQLSSDLGINMHTVNKVYKILENEGFVSINKKKGAFINLDIQRLEANYDEDLLIEDLELKLLIYKNIKGNLNKLEELWRKTNE